MTYQLEAEWVQEDNTGAENVDETGHYQREHPVALEPAEEAYLKNFRIACD